MLDDQVQTTHEAPSAASADQAGAGATPRWSSLWQMPTILLSMALIGLAVAFAVHTGGEEDFGAALDQVDALIEAGDLEGARHRLHDGIEPHLELAGPLEQARFAATVADWLYFNQRAAGLRTPATDRQIAEHYARAAGAGRPLEPARLEQWAEAAIGHGDVESARHRLEELEALSLTSDGGDDIRQRRNRVMRRLVEASLRRDDRQPEQLMELLERYRRDELLDPADELWVAVQQAELRLHEGRFGEAIDRLMIDARRVEGRAGGRTPPGIGSVHVLLGRAHERLGQVAAARHHLEQALRLLPAGNPRRGEAQLWLGRLDAAAQQHEAARERFEQVLIDYPATAVEAPALLARAEVLAVLGDHEAALRDYGRLAELHAGTVPPVEPARELIASSLVDRHDAALATAELDLALRYVRQAEALFESASVPSDVLARLAATNRQLADDLLAAPAAEDESPDDAQQRRVAAAARARAAGDAAVRLVRALVGLTEADEQWADALWLAAESYDLAGDHELAVRHFSEYLAGRPADDPRRPAALFRLGQAHEARLEHAEAAGAYAEVIEHFPRSIEASRSFVPLARQQVILERATEAEALLRDVVAGRRHLEPDAVDYRSALIALGRLLEEQGKYAEAIERLEEARRRYGAGRGIEEIVFHLAEAHRGRSAELRAALEQPLEDSPAQRQELAAARQHHLEQSMELYGQVRLALDATDPARLTADRREMLRSAMLYHADGAFQLGRHGQAIPLYEQLVQRYPQEPLAMTAMVQIVNCYVALGDREKAQAAHRRALLRLSRLPDAAFERSGALLDRAAWEQWLTHTPLGALAAEEAMP